MKKHLDIVFDIDGVICDLWGTAEIKLRLSPDELVQKFRFSRNVTDFGLTDVPQIIKEPVMTALLDPINFKNPLPMYKTKAVPRRNTDWQTFDYFILDSRIEYKAFAKFLNMLAQEHNVTLHTHVYDETTEKFRTAWFNANIKPYAPTVKCIYSIGQQKNISHGDLLFEDNLTNVLKADCDCKVMVGLFHNIYKSKENQRIYNSFADKPNAQNFVCVESNLDCYAMAVQAALAYYNSDTSMTSHIESFKATYADMWQRYLLTDYKDTAYYDGIIDNEVGLTHADIFKAMLLQYKPV